MIRLLMYILLSISASVNPHPTFKSMEPLIDPAIQYQRFKERMVLIHAEDIVIDDFQRCTCAPDDKLLNIDKESSRYTQIFNY